jgi:hypothetical protein
MESGGSKEKESMGNGFILRINHAKHQRIPAYTFRVYSDASWAVSARFVCIATTSKAP